MIASFGYRKEHDGSWVKKGAQPIDEEGHLPVGEDSSVLQRILDRFDGLQTFVGERFDALELQVDMRFDEMDSRITKVEGDVSYIRTCFDLPSSYISSIFNIISTLISSRVFGYIIILFEQFTISLFAWYV